MPENYSAKELDEQKEKIKADLLGAVTHQKIHRLPSCRAAGGGQDKARRYIKEPSIKRLLSVNELRNH